MGTPIAEVEYFNIFYNNPKLVATKVTYDEETEEWNICRTSTLFYQLIKLRSVDFKFKLDEEFDEVGS